MILHRTFFQTYRTIAYNNSLEFQFQIEYRHKDIFEHYLEQIRLHSVGNAEWPLYNKIAGNAHARTIDLNLALFLVAMFGKRARFSQSFHSYFGETIWIDLLRTSIEYNLFELGLNMLFIGTFFFSNVFEMEEIQMKWGKDKIKGKINASQRFDSQ